MNFAQYLIEWIEREKLLAATDPGRTARGLRIRQVKNQVYEIEGKKYNLDKIEFSSRSVEHTEPDEDQPHKGYVLYEPKTLHIFQLYCSCVDFGYRLYAPMVKKGLATFNIEPKYANIENKRTGKLKRHNRQWTKVTNPNGDIYLCKHLYSIVKNYLAKTGAKVEPIKPKTPIQKKPEKSKFTRTEPKKPKKPLKS